MENWKDRWFHFMASEEVTFFICGFNIAALIAILLH